MTDTYTRGNIHTFLQNIQSTAPTYHNLITKTVEPIIYASMIELLGASSKFTRIAGEARLRVEQEQTKEIFISFSFIVPDFMGYVGAEDAIRKDEAFLLQKCQMISEVTWGPRSVTIDVVSGLVTVAFSIPAGEARNAN